MQLESTAWKRKEYSSLQTQLKCSATSQAQFGTRRCLVGHYRQSISDWWWLHGLRRYTINCWWGDFVKACYRWYWWWWNCIIKLHLSVEWGTNFSTVCSRKHVVPQQSMKWDTISRYGVKTFRIEPMETAITESNESQIQSEIEATNDNRLTVRLSGIKWSAPNIDSKYLWRKV